MGITVNLLLPHPLFSEKLFLQVAMLLCLGYSNVCFVYNIYVYIFIGLWFNSRTQVGFQGPILYFQLRNLVVLFYIEVLGGMFSENCKIEWSSTSW